MEPQADLVVRDTDVFAPEPSVLSTVVDGHLVLLDRGRGRTTLLNASAALIYLSFDGLRPVSAVVDVLEAETGIDRRLLRSDLSGTVGRLVANGVLMQGGHEAEPPTSADHPTGVEPEGSRWAAVVERRLAAGSWVFNRPRVPLCGAVCDLRTDDEEVAELLERLLPGPSIVSEASMAAHHLTIAAVERSDGSRRFRVVLDGRVVAKEREPGLAVARALHHLDVLAVEATTGALLFHAGAVERDGQVVVILGLSGKGKSTLTAALVQQGWRYVSDEVVAVDPGTGLVRPHPKALDLAPASLELLGMEHPDADLGSAKLKVRSDRLGAVTTGGEVVRLVLLGEVVAPLAGFRAPVERVPPAEALVALVPVTFEQTLAEPAHFDALGDLCERVPTFRLGRAALPDAVATVTALAEG